MYGVADRWRSLSRRGPTTLLNSLLDIFLPTVCVLCRQPGKMLCQACLDGLPRVATPFCHACGRPTRQARGQCPACRRDPLPLQQVRAPLLYEQAVPRLIQQFKYHHKRALAEPLGRLMIAVLPDLSHDIDLIIPLPLHPQRQRQRGYNQAELLANEVAGAMDRPVELNGLRRSRATLPQAKLSAAARQSNIAAAFTADPEFVSDQQILLVDDVCTTGATLASAAQALFAAGAHTVTGLCAARAP